ncbi:nucleotidyltransferase family protein [Marinoscillum furvescens]|uniref:Molybdenum cofactor cytidylyltransferase n=1 Tax=Marinoscillum furvescens DSM 4134 TaxID=1122208 RepID=A0A3D9KY26_MARFU|nr:nucleotidyltransferase family protein [Marinoscillum furvescens]RED92209.1 molybdenum cofactor cytidylyltransferase [Marinoscillum furvescens DSM 4134]
MSEQKNIGVVVLAAGSSRRMGEPKQLLPYDSSVLLQHELQKVKELQLAFSVVVLGANASQILQHIDVEGFEVVENTEWEEGIASSIRAGLKACEQHRPELEGVLIVLGDQPRIQAQQLHQIVCADSELVAASYAGQVGVPAYFGRRYFSELKQLTGDRGAKAVLMSHSHEIKMIEIPEAAMDIDTRQQYEEVLKQHRIDSK